LEGSAAEWGESQYENRQNYARAVALDRVGGASYYGASAMFPVGYGGSSFFTPQHIAPPTIFPTVRVSAPQGSEEPSNPADTGYPAVPPQAEDVVIDPEANPTTTVFEQGALILDFPNPYQNTAPTDWDAVYDEYVILNAPTAPRPSVPTEVTEVFHGSIDWGDVLGNIGGSIVGGLFDPLGLQQPTQNFISNLVTPTAAIPAAVAGPSVPTGGAQVPAAACGGGPRYGKICLATGVVTPLKHRRRRRLLTASDINDLAALKALVGNSAGMQAAVVKAVRR
jgi:hypothetical protein